MDLVLNKISKHSFISTEIRAEQIFNELNHFYNNV